MKRDFVVDAGAAVQEVTDAIMRDIQRRMDKARKEIINVATLECRINAENLTNRLPAAGGGSYGQRHHNETHHDPEGSMGDSTGIAYNDHQYAASIEFGQEGHPIRAKNPQGMRIERVLPGYYKERDINTVPYGAKYERLDPPLRVPHVNWPGSRAFHVYRDTWRRQCNRMVSIIRRALKRAMS